MSLLYKLTQPTQKSISTLRVVCCIFENWMLMCEKSLQFKLIICLMKGTMPAKFWMTYDDEYGYAEPECQWTRLYHYYISESFNYFWKISLYGRISYFIRYLMLLVSEWEWTSLLLMITLVLMIMARNTSKHQTCQLSTLTKRIQVFPSAPRHHSIKSYWLLLTIQYSHSM